MATAQWQWHDDNGNGNGNGNGNVKVVLLCVEIQIDQSPDPRYLFVNQYQHQPFIYQNAEYLFTLSQNQLYFFGPHTHKAFQFIDRLRTAC